MKTPTTTTKRQSRRRQARKKTSNKQKNTPLRKYQTRRHSHRKRKHKMNATQKNHGQPWKEATETKKERTKPNNQKDAKRPNQMKQEKWNNNRHHKGINTRETRPTSPPRNQGERTNKHNHRKQNRRSIPEQTHLTLYSTETQQQGKTTGRK